MVAVVAVYLIKGLMGGSSSTTNSGVQVQDAATCLADCSKKKLSDNCDQYCIGE